MEQVTIGIDRGSLPPPDGNMAQHPTTLIIQNALAMRGSTDNDFVIHSEHGVPTYVVRMCEALVHVINTTSVLGTNLKKLLLLESTCTGADYERKLTLHCLRLVG